MNVLYTITIFAILYLLYKTIRTHLTLLFHSNLKYKLLDFLADYIHYGDDIGIHASLSLDGVDDDSILEDRLLGQHYLESKLGSKKKEEKEKEKRRGQSLAKKIVDCRFALHKMLMPLLRELELPRENFIKNVLIPDDGDTGMHRVKLDDGSTLMYVGNDAVHTLGIKSFYEPVQEEINRRMSLKEGGGNGSMLRFAPISLNPELEKNADLILGMTGMDQVRYCLSGSEATDAALKDIRSSTRPKKLVIRFQSAYHGHVSGVDFLNCGSNHIFLPECSASSLSFIEEYHYLISAVIVNPMQHFTGINKASPPGEKLTFGKRQRVEVSREEYARWLHDLQEKCRYASKFLTKIAFVVDDIYFAFRTPELFSSKYFLHPDTKKELQPDVMILGKGVAAGYPLSMVLGRKGYLNTYDKKYLLQVNKTVGTLAAWHGGIVASNVFLEAITDTTSTTTTTTTTTTISPKEQLRITNAKFDAFTSRLNDRFTSNALPLRIRNFANTFSIDYLSSTLYNSRYTQYLLAEGIFLANYSTGKFNLNADDADHADDDSDLLLLADKFINAGLKMKQHGYFHPCSTKQKLILLFSLLRRFFIQNILTYYHQIMHDKHIDIQVSHNHPVNKFGHFWSSVFMILMAYPNCLLWNKPVEGWMWFLGTHALRQSGHFFYEKQDDDIEKQKFGHKDSSKKQAVFMLVLIGLVYRYRMEIIVDWLDMELPTVTLGEGLTLVGLLTIVPHFVEITHEFGMMRGVSWLLKIFTDPFTDLIDFYEYWIIHPRYFLDLKDQNAKYRLDVLSKKVEKLS